VPFKDHLEVLKLSNNKITTTDQVKVLAGLNQLKQLDLSNNAICEIEDYRNAIYDLLPNLMILDGRDREDVSFYSDDVDDYGEEGEHELHDILNRLDPETRERVENGEIDIEELREMGLMPGGDDEGDEYGDLDDFGEEGELEMDEEGEEEAPAKRPKHSESDSEDE